MLLLLLLIGGGSYAWGEEITFTAPEGWTTTGAKQSFTKDGVTISTTQGAGDVQYRIYKGQTFTVSSTVGNITKIEITCTANNTTKYGPGCFEAIEGYSYSEKIGTWTGSATSVRLKASSNQVRATKIVVTVESAPAANLTSIAVSGTPTNKTYFDGEPFDPTGLVVTGTYDDGTKKEITEGIGWVKDPEILKLGTTSVDVIASVGNIVSGVYTVEGITVKEKVTLIGIEANGTPDDFWKGDKFNKNGITVTALWSDGSESDVTEQCQFTEPDMTTAGKKTVTVTYENKECTYEIEVKTIENTKETAYTVSEAKKLIDAGKDLATQVYVKGIVSKIDSYNDKYKSITYWLDDNTFQVYSGKGLDGKDFTSQDDIEIGANVIICGKIKKFNNNTYNTYEFDKENYLVEYKAPVEKVLKSIAISGEATKTTYTEGETFDPAGLVVTATYEDESTEVVTSRVEWTFNPETLILGTTEVNVTATYGEKTASKTVAVTVAEVQKYNVTWNVNGNDYTEGNPTTEVVEGEKVEVLPAAPASIVGLVFMGWTNEAVTSQEAAPAVLFTSAADAPAVTADVTYYAVFAAQAGAGWTRVTALGDITEGSYVIKNADFVLPSSNTGSGEAPGKVLAPSITGNVITGEVDESMVWQFVSTGTSNQFYVKNAAGDYLYANKSNDGVRVHRTSDKWTFEENGEGYFSMMDENSSRYCATYEAGQDWRSYLSKDHGNYANGGKLELYRNDISYSNYTTTVETNSLILRAFDGKNHFATFSSDKAVKFVDATVYAVGVNDDRLILTEVESKQVPANTGVLLKSAGTEATYSVIGSAPAIENNLLCASVEEGQTTAADGTTEGYSFFKLSYNQAGENEKLGFYWAKENGAPFVSKAGLAYLAVKTADVAAVKGFSLFDMETGISKVSGSAAGNGVIYDLQGRRVERAVRGLYIVNGRKVMVK